MFRRMVRVFALWCLGQAERSVRLRYADAWLRPRLTRMCRVRVEGVARLCRAAIAVVGTAFL